MSANAQGNVTMRYDDRSFDAATRYFMFNVFCVHIFMDAMGFYFLEFRRWKA